MIRVGKIEDKVEGFAGQMFFHQSHRLGVVQRCSCQRNKKISMYVLITDR
jgi:hypothetical protein